MPYRFDNHRRPSVPANPNQSVAIAFTTFSGFVLITVSMDMTFSSFGNRMDAAGGVKPDFHALIAFLAAAQAAQPTGRLATRLAMGGDSQVVAVESLITVFAPRPGSEGINVMGQGQALKGCFNPAVPISYIPVTKKKGW